MVEALIDVPVASGDTVRPTGRGCQGLTWYVPLSTPPAVTGSTWWGFVDLDSFSESDPCGDICICKTHNYPVWNLGGCGEKCHRDT